MKIRYCSKCERGQPLTEEFYNKSKTHRAGFETVCKLCKKEYYKEYYRKNKRRLLEQNKEYYMENRKEIIARTSRWKKEKGKKLKIDGNNMYKCRACGYEGDYCCEQEYIDRLDMDGNIVHESKKCCPRCSEHKGFIEKQE